MRNELLKFYNFSIKNFNLKKIILIEFIYLVIVLVLNYIEYELLRIKNKIFDKDVLFYSILCIILLSFLSFALFYFNKKIKSKFLLWIGILFSPKIWGFGLMMGISILSSYFEYSIQINFFIIFVFMILTLIVFFDKSVHKKINKIFDLKNNSIFSSVFIFLILVYISIGNSRFQLRLYGVTLNGLFRIATGTIVLSYYFIIDLISSIMAMEEDEDSL